MCISLICVITFVFCSFTVSEYREEDVINYNIKAKELEQKPSEMTHDNDLVHYALDKINEDRAQYKLPPVNLSRNIAAQIHAENLLAQEINSLPIGRRMV